MVKETGMKRLFLPLLPGAALFLAAAPLQATNGDKLIGVGPYSRSMGGVGIATPCCAITAVFANPATLSTISGTQFDFGASLFLPRPKARVQSPAPPAGKGTWKGASRDAPFPVPAIVLRSALGKEWSLGLAAVGVGGMGVDYRNRDPQGESTNLSAMKFSPALAFRKGDFSFGLGLDMDFNSADLGSGESHGFAFGAHLGFLYKWEDVAFGLTYRTPQPVDHERILDFDGDGRKDDFTLENPQEIGAGLSWRPVKKVLLEGDVKWLDWHGARGYEDLDWKSQWVFALGAEFHVTPRLRLRCGYNYARNPLRNHDGWSPSSTVSMEGPRMNRLDYEYLRVIGFPAVVEHHITAGIGWDLSEEVVFNLAVVRGFRNTIEENSSGNTVKLKSSVSEFSLDFGLTWRF